MPSGLRHVGESLERALRHWRERGALMQLAEAADLPAMTIAISRERGAGGSAIASAIATKLGWPVYDRQLVDKIAEDAGVRSQLVDQLDESRPHWFAECVESLSDEKHMTGSGFAVRLRKVLVALYCHGNCIVVGRGAAQVMSKEHTLRVRLVAPLDFRVE